MKQAFVLAFIFVLLAGCALTQVNAPSPTTAPTLAPTPLPTNTPIPPPTNTPTATSTPTEIPTPTITPFAPFKAKAMVNNLNIRSNPGRLFDVIANLKEGVEFTIIGRISSGEWMYVQLANERKGWAFTELVQSEVNLMQAPIIEPTGVQLVRGRVLTPAGEPVNGIQFSLVQGTGINLKRDDAQTDSEGLFTIYLPTTASGEWALSYAAVSCTSNVMDADCNCKNGVCGSVDPSSINITLPYTEIIPFRWQ